MGRVIVIGLVIVTVVVIIALVTMYFRRKSSQEKARERGWATKGDLNLRQEQKLLSQLDEAEWLFRQLLTPPADLSGEMTILRSDHRLQIESWLRNELQTSILNTRRAIDHS
ncbi:MAG TPA: hypothetical protein VIY48_01755 [Candidatus Paceibacterota bacterium]